MAQMSLTGSPPNKAQNVATLLVKFAVTPLGMGSPLLVTWRNNFHISVGTFLSGQSLALGLVS